MNYYQKCRQLATIAALIVVACFPSASHTEKPDDPIMDIIHINVGQGDATLILGPVIDGKRISVLIDAGDIPMGGDPDGGEITSRTLAGYGVKSLTYFVATHYDSDHIGGVVMGRSHIHGTSFLAGSTGQIDVKTFLDRGVQDTPSSKTYILYRAIADAMGTRISLDSQETVDDFALDLGNGAFMLCLASNGFVRGMDAQVPLVDTENERSMTFVVRYGGFDYLIGGDTIGRVHGRENAKVEAAVAVALKENNIEIDVYKVNHHGANNASSSALLEMAKPEVAIISVGSRNRHGHPHVQALLRLKAAGVLQIYQTELGASRAIPPPTIVEMRTVMNGDILLRTNGRQYQIGATTRCVDN